jgi:hypothetical protein
LAEAASADSRLRAPCPKAWAVVVAGSVLATSTLLGIVIAAVSVFTVAAVVWLFIWAAKKDGEEDLAIQRRLGIRRRTRLGR